MPKIRIVDLEADEPTRLDSAGPSAGSLLFKVTGAEPVSIIENDTKTVADGIEIEVGAWSPGIPLTAKDSVWVRATAASQVGVMESGL